jgi:rubrerythrin
MIIPVEGLLFMKKVTRSSHSNNGKRTKTSRTATRSRPGKNRLNSEWLKGFLSEMLATEEGGVQLYERALNQLEHEELRAKLEQYHQQTERHVELCHAMLDAAGADAESKSPGAEATEQKAQGLMDIEVPEELSDLNNIENLVLAETKDQWNWQTLSSLMAQIEDSQLKKVVSKAVREVERQERDHVNWNQKTLTKLATEAARRQPEQMQEQDEAGHAHQGME